MLRLSSTTDLIGTCAGHKTASGSGWSQALLLRAIVRPEYGVGTSLAITARMLTTPRYNILRPLVLMRWCNYTLDCLTYYLHLLVGGVGFEPTTNEL